MTLRRVEAHANYLNIVFLEISNAIAKPACFFRATGRIIFRIEIEQHNFFADVIGKFPGLAILVLSLNERRFVSNFRSFGSSSREYESNGNCSRQSQPY